MASSKSSHPVAAIATFALTLPQWLRLVLLVMHLLLCPALQPDL